MGLYVWWTALKEAYLWAGWTNAVAYYPLNSTTTTSDTSWNWNNLTKSWTVTFGTYEGVDCAYFNGGYLYINKSLILWSNPRTISCWFYRTSAVANGGAFWGMGNATSQNWITAYTHASGYALWQIGYGNWNVDLNYPNQQTPLNGWDLLTFTYDGTNAGVYLNWSYLWTPYAGESQSTTAITLNLTNTRTAICAFPNLSWTWFKGYMSEFIFESVTRSSQQAWDYYNQTKWNYWL